MSGSDLRGKRIRKDWRGGYIVEENMIYLYVILRSKVAYALRLCQTKIPA
jgi:hypothetical protein